MKDKLTAIRESRGQDYGPVEQNHEAIGSMWDGILYQFGWMFRGRRLANHPEIVTLMMSAVKHAREAFRHKQDNIDDAKNYLDFTAELAVPHKLEVSQPPREIEEVFCDFSELTDEEIDAVLNDCIMEVECAQDR